MSADLISTSFIEDSGLLEMADANQIVLLLPQVSIYSQHTGHGDNNLSIPVMGYINGRP